MIKTLKLAAICASLGFGSLCMAGQYADQLSDCVYKNLSADDKKVILQWGFVSLGKTSAAREIATIPDAKTKAVNDKAKTAMKTLVLEKCGKEASKVALYEQKQGMQDAATNLATRLAKEQLAGKLDNILPDLSSAGTTNVLKAGAVLDGFFKKR